MQKFTKGPAIQYSINVLPFFRPSLPPIPSSFLVSLSGFANVHFCSLIVNSGYPAASPAKLPPFCGPFQGVLLLTASPVTHRLFNCVFRQAADPASKFWSDKLLHEVYTVATI